MKKLEEQAIRALMKATARKGKHTFTLGIVQEVADQSCKVGLYENVRLSSIIAEEMGSFVRIYPKIGSTAIIGRIEGTDEAFLVATSEIERVIVQMGEQIFEMKNGKFSIKNQQTDLRYILESWLTQLSTASIITPQGPGNFSPADAQVFQDLKNQIGQLLL